MLIIYLYILLCILLYLKILLYNKKLKFKNFIEYSIYNIVIFTLIYSYYYFNIYNSIV